MAAPGTVLSSSMDIFGDYAPTDAFDEAFEAPGKVRDTYRSLVGGLQRLEEREFQRRRSLIELVFRNQGITFTVYGNDEGVERTFPFDPIARLIPAEDWGLIERGLRQRVHAINLFLADVYGEQGILRDAVVPGPLVLRNANYRPEVRGLDLPHGAFTHVVGCDIIRDVDGRYLVLEDNLRSPSGVSYMLLNRRVMARSFPKLLAAHDVRPIQHYPSALLRTLRSLSPRDATEPTVVLLTPGPFNSAYFEHAFLAQQMGIELVEGRDLLVDEGRVWMRTTTGRSQVDVIYRRVDDAFLDPMAFRADTMLGVPGLVEVVRSGRVALANAIGTGVADDKAIYAFIPAIIRYYLGEAPLLANVPTFLGGDKDGLEAMLTGAEDLVIKEVGGSGGYGMLIGPESSKAERAKYLDGVRADPANYIAQPVIRLSTHPSYRADTGACEPCHVDLRPYVLVGEEITVVPGGLTRVALKRGSLVVNSSQGGGSKDTWVLAGDGEGER